MVGTRRNMTLPTFVLLLCVFLGINAHYTGRPHTHEELVQDINSVQVVPGHEGCLINPETGEHIHKDVTSTDANAEPVDQVVIEPGPMQTMPSPMFPQKTNQGMCMSLVRRTVVGMQAVTYPCFQPIPGVVPQVAQQSPMGLICRGIARVPKVEFHNVPTCCPGWVSDKAGGCVQRRAEGQLIIQKTLQPRMSSGTAVPQYTSLEQALKQIQQPQQQSQPLPQQQPQQQQQKQQQAVEIKPLDQQPLEQPQQQQQQLNHHHHGHSHDHSTAHGHDHTHTDPTDHSHMSEKEHAYLHANNIPHDHHDNQAPHVHHADEKQQPQPPKAMGLEHLTPYPTSTPAEKRAKLIIALKRQPLARFGNSMMQWAPRAMIMRQIEMLRRKKMSLIRKQAQAARQAQVEALRQAQAEAIRQAQAEAIKQAEAYRQAEMARQTEAYRREEHNRYVEAVMRQQAEAMRKAEAMRQHAEYVRQAEAIRHAELLRKAQAEALQAEALRQAESIKRRQLVIMGRRPEASFMQAQRIVRRLVPKGVLFLHIIRTLKPQINAIKEAIDTAQTQNMNMPGKLPETMAEPVTEKPFPIIPKPKEPELSFANDANTVESRPQKSLLQQMIDSFSNIPPEKEQASTNIPDMAINDLRPKPSQDVLPYPELPRFPIETPPIQIQPGPNSPFNALPACFSNYVSQVKKCLADAKVELPSQHNFLPGQSSYDQSRVCEKRQMIKDCIVNNLTPCNDIAEQMLVQRTLSDTMAEINKDCQFHDLDSIETRLVGAGPLPDMPLPNTPFPDMSLSDMPMLPNIPLTDMPSLPSLPALDTPLIDKTKKVQKSKDDTEKDHVHSRKDSVQNKLELIEPLITPMEVLPMDKKPVDPKPEPVTKPKEPEVKTEAPVVQVPVEEVPTPKQKDEPKEANSDDIEPKPASLPHAHGVHVETMAHDYYLPLMIGMAIGVAAIVILLSALLCICCKRRIKKRVYMEKESEKPKLFDGVYTIGVPPPVYEVNGIPPISYEEAKGEKITGSPSSLRRNNIQNEVQEGLDTSSVKGCVSEI